MKTIGFIVDSIACTPADELAKNEIGYLPFRSDIDGTTFEDYLDLPQEKILSMIKVASSVKSSLPRLDKMENMLEEMSKKYDYVIYLPISECLSSTFATASNLAKEYPNVTVYNNEFGGNQFLEVIRFAKKVFKETQEISKVIKALDYIKERSMTFVLPNDLKFVINGGRVSTMKKFALKTMKLLHLYPFIKYHNNSATTGGIAKSFKGAAKQVIEKLLKFAQLHKFDDSTDSYRLTISCGIDKDAYAELIQVCNELNVKFSNEGILCSSIALHTGPGAFAIGIMPNVDKINVKF
ncbi:UNVERIFIED_CONTAM: DegV family protein [Campylobacter lari]